MARWLRLRALPLVLGMLLVQGCATRVQLPPRVELAEWGTIGIVSFGGDADPQLADLATGQFLQMLHAAQPGARLLELGPEAHLLAEIGHREMDFEAVRALGERFGVDAVFMGALELSELKPDLQLGQALTSVRASASVNGRLATKLLETRSGAAVWSRSAQASANVARIGAHAGGGLPSFRVGDPRDAYENLVPELVGQLSGDFYPTWTRGMRAAPASNVLALASTR